MAQPGSTSRVVLALVWLVVGSAMVGVPSWLGWTRWPALLSSHPAMLVVGIACGVLGFVALAWSVAMLAVGGRVDRTDASGRPTRRTPEQLARASRRRIVLAIPALIVCVAMVGLLAYARPFVATPVATAALQSGSGVDLVNRISWYELVPKRSTAEGRPIKPTTALVFAPGARVDPRAYAQLLRPLAAGGYLVAVLKDPFGFALFERDHAESVIDVHPEITHWAVGGHSLGGVAASGFADGHPEVQGLVLYAAYPASAMTRTDLKVVSISGSADGLATPATIEEHKALLPANTRYVVLPGAVHGDFGDYGVQPGDGTPTADRAAVQTEVAKATTALLASLTPPAPKKKKK